MKSFILSVSLVAFSSALDAEIPLFNNTTEVQPERQTEPKAFTFEIKKQVFKTPVTALHSKLKGIREKTQAKLKANGQLKSSVPTELQLLNTYDTQYTGPVFLGTPWQGSSSSKFVYDTGSGFLTVAGATCGSCTNKYYTQTSSATEGATGYSETSLSYGSAKLNGKMLTDNVCIETTNSNTATQLGFFYITSQTGLDGLDGILGFSPIADGNGPSYVQALYSANKIPEEVVSYQLNYDSNNQPSMMTLGGTNSTAYLGDLYSHSTVKQFSTWWTLEYNGASYDGNALPSTSVQNAIVDTGTSFMYLPETEYQAFVAKVNSPITLFDCGNSYCFTTTQTCETILSTGQLKSLSITLDNKTYTIPPQGYLLTPASVYAEKCLIPIASAPDSDGATMLGDTFMRNFYTVFDYKSNTVKMAPNKANAWAAETMITSKGLSGISIAMIVIGCLLITAIITFIAYKCAKRSKQNTHVYETVSRNPYPQD